MEIGGMGAFCMVSCGAPVVVHGDVRGHNHLEVVLGIERPRGGDGGERAWYRALPLSGWRRGQCWLHGIVHLHCLRARTRPSFSHPPGPEKGYRA